MRICFHILLDPFNCRICNTFDLPVTELLIGLMNKAKQSFCEISKLSMNLRSSLNLSVNHKGRSLMSNNYNMN